MTPTTSISNRLNAPRQIHNGSGQAVWAWNITSFGANPPNENPSELGTFTYNLRYPSQYYDAESGLHYYNYFRDYDPKIGRYRGSSDSVGLAWAAVAALM